MTDLLDKAGSGSVEPEDFNAVVDAIESGPTGKVTAADIDSLAAQDGDVLTADGAGNATWETGGGSQPVAESLIGAGSAADGDGGNISFGTLQGGPLLDYTTPAVPVVISAGFYIFAGYCKCNDGTQISGSFSARAVLSGTDVAGLVLGTTSLQDAGTTGTPSIPLCAAGQLEAGDTVFVAFTNGSGIVGTLNFLAEMTILKL